MARLYNGFNSLALGQAINNTNNDIHNRRMTGLQMLGSSLQDLARAHKEEEEKQAQKQSALDFLTGNGMSQASAQAMVNSGIAPGELTKYMQGRLDKKADTEDERSYEDKIYGRNRADALSDRDAQWAHDLEMWAKQNGITNEQAIKMAVFGHLMNNRGVILSKDHGNSRAGVDELNANTSQIQDFMKNNPSFAFNLNLLSQGNVNAANDGYYDEDIAAKLRKYGSKEYNDDDRESLLKDLGEHDKLSYIMGNPYFNDAILAFGANVDKKELMKQVNLQRLLGGNTTETQRDREIKVQKYKKMVAKAQEKLDNYANNRVDADFSDEEIRALWKKPKNRGVLRRKYGKKIVELNLER